jgi:terminase large subunit-like protein
MTPQTEIDRIITAANVARASAAARAGKVPKRNGPLRLHLRTPHPKQQPFIDSTVKRKVIRAGRRGGKTVGIAIDAVKRFAAGRRVLYAAPTQDQVDRFWYEVKHALESETDAGRLYKNETKHIIEKPGTEQRLRAKTAWNPDTLRGDYADYLILDEWQLMDEDTWKLVGAPMLLDNNGDAVFIYTPPSRRARSTSKAKDKMHAAKLYKRAGQDTTGRWATFHFSSFDNPHISEEALSDITADMSRLDYEQEILAIDKEDNPGALWTSEQIESLRVTQTPSRFERIVVSVDPSATSGGDEAGIVTAGVGLCDCKGTSERHGFILEDATLQGSPHQWAAASVTAYNKWKADRMVAESNNGGEMVSLTIGTIKGAPPVKLIHASRGKQTRAEPVAALYEQRKVHHAGTFTKLEDEMTQWDPSMPESPNRMDAMVWALTELMIDAQGWSAFA